ncbi:MAG: hypothetical protein FWE95_02745, partial [Planctomycetaceae bacterium]|nr:hypothetical protein [Planctomycetaceae bacterium]
MKSFAPGVFILGFLVITILAFGASGISALFSEDPAVMPIFVSLPLLLVVLTVLAGLMLYLVVPEKGLSSLEHLRTFAPSPITPTSQRPIDSPPTTKID